MLPKSRALSAATPVALLLIVAGCAQSSASFSLADAEAVPYGQMVGNELARATHYTWDTADSLQHYMLLAEQLFAGEPSRPQPARRVTALSLALDIGAETLTIDRDQPWVDGVNAALDERQLEFLNASVGAISSGATAIKWTTSHANGDPESLVDEGFALTSGYASRLIDELGLTCSIKGYDPQTGYQGAQAFVERYRGVHHYRRYDCGEVELLALATVVPGSAQTLSYIKLNQKDTIAHPVATLAAAYQRFTGWGIKGASVANSSLADAPRQIDIWYAGQSLRLPQVSKTCPCTIARGSGF
ncbi:MAG: hypothetical protein II007_03450 [Gammaproteobacteria bacterium]|nr:hypothetical protein [Gammaproteobacteria bacterium]